MKPKAKIGELARREAALRRELDRQRRHLTDPRSLVDVQRALLIVMAKQAYRDDRKDRKLA